MGSISAFLEIHDIVGLVKGAHEGQGLGNNFLSYIRAIDDIFHVLHLEVITAELRLKDIKRTNEDLEKSMKRSYDKQLKIELEVCLKGKAWLESEKDIRLGD